MTSNKFAQENIRRRENLTINSASTRAGFIARMSKELSAEGKFAKVTKIDATEHEIIVTIERPKYYTRFPGFDRIRKMAEQYFAAFIIDGKPEIKLALTPEAKKSKLAPGKNQDGILIR